MVITLALGIGTASASGPDRRTLALTIDDLPYVASDATPASPTGQAAEATAMNRRLLAALHRHHVPVTGFVIQKSAEDLAGGVGSAILKQWVAGGFDLGNHSYAHPDFNGLTIADGEDQITRGEAGFLSLMQGAHRDARFFRFPMNHTGDTREKHDAWAAFLAGRGYRTAPCTIETEDWMFNIVYGRMLAAHDTASAKRLRKDYLAFAAAEIDYYVRLNRHVLGYEPPQVMLIHDDQLNADVIEDLLKLVESRQFRFVTLAEAEADPVYRAPEALITSYGPMWGYRWARERGVKVDGSLEPEAPKWVTEYKAGAAPMVRRPRTQF